MRLSMPLILILSLSPSRYACIYLCTFLLLFQRSFNFFTVCLKSSLFLLTILYGQEEEFRPVSRVPQGGYGAYNAYISAATRYAALGAPTLYDHPGPVYGSMHLLKHACGVLHCLSTQLSLCFLFCCNVG